MKEVVASLKPLMRVAAMFYATFVASSAFAETSEVDSLLNQLREAPAGEAERLSAEIEARWSASGSAAMDYLLMQGRAALEQEDYDTAIHHFTALVDHAPQFAEGWNQRATAFFYAERYGEALHDIEQTLALNPQHYNALTGLGLILQAMGYDQEALKAFDAVLAIHPHQPQVEETAAKLRAALEGTAL